MHCDVSNRGEGLHRSQAIVLGMRWSVTRSWQKQGALPADYDYGILVIE